MHNMILKESVMITPSGFFDFLKKDKGECELRDNPKFTSRTRNVDANTKTRWNNAINNVVYRLVDTAPENMDLYLQRVGELNAKVVHDSNIQLQYQDQILDYTFLSSTLVEKLGYVTYFKEFMTWYDLSEKLVDLLSIMTGTSPEIIECFLSRYLKHNMPGITVKEFSRSVLSDKYIPAGYMLGILDNLCPTVNNFMKGLLAIGLETNYTIRGRMNLSHQEYEFITGQAPESEYPESMTSSELIDSYLCSVMRLLCYYILQNIYQIIVDKRKSEWNEDTNAGRIQLSELLTGWSHAELVFQNSKKRDFPIITLKGRNDLTTDILPCTFSVEEALEAYLKGDLYL